MLNSFNITQTGQSHITADKPCQDYSFSQIETINGTEYVISAVSDGVGSCEFSQYGSEIAVNTVIEYISEQLHKVEDFDEAVILDIIKRGFESVLEKIEARATQTELPYLEFDCTLTVSVFNGNDLYYGHCGDGGIVILYRDSHYEMITHRHKGEEFNSVCPVRDTSEWEFGGTSNIVSFVMMTDGVLDSCVDIEQHNNRIFWPFLESALSADIKDKTELQELRDVWDTFFRIPPEEEGSIRRRVTDDITFLLVINTEAVISTQIPEFDLKKWREESEEYKRQREEILYKRFNEYTESQKVSDKQQTHNTRIKKGFRRKRRRLLKKVRHSASSEKGDN